MSRERKRDYGRTGHLENLPLYLALLRSDYGRTGHLENRRLEWYR